VTDEGAYALRGAIWARRRSPQSGGDEGRRAPDDSRIFPMPSRSPTWGSSPFCPRAYLSGVAPDTAETFSLIERSATDLPLTEHLSLHGFSRWGVRAPRSWRGSELDVRLSTSSPCLCRWSGGLPPRERQGWLVRSSTRVDLRWRTREGNIAPRLGSICCGRFSRVARRRTAPHRGHVRRHF